MMKEGWLTDRGDEGGWHLSPDPLLLEETMTAALRNKFAWGRSWK